MRESIAEETEPTEAPPEGSPEGSPDGLPDRAPRKRGWIGVLLVLAAVLAVIGGLIAVKGSQIGMLIAYGEQATAEGPPPETVGTAVVEEREQVVAIETVGTVRAHHGVAVTTPSPGTVSEILFESGQAVRRGEVLLRMDTRLERARLREAQARQRQAQRRADRSRPLSEDGTVAPAEADADEAAAQVAAAQVQAIAVEIEQKTIRAPFSGRLGIRQVDVGQYLAPGAAITRIEALDQLFVDFSVAQRHLDDLHVGTTLALVRPGHADAPLQATVQAVSSRVSASTRNVDVRATVPTGEVGLRPGMFVELSLPRQRRRVVMVPDTAITRAPYGDTVFVVERDPERGPVARTRRVTTGDATGDYVAVLSGLEPGAEVVTLGVFKLHDGARVTVNNEHPLPASLNPEPPNR